MGHPTRLTRRTRRCAQSHKTALRRMTRASAQAQTVHRATSPTTARIITIALVARTTVITTTTAPKTLLQIRLTTQTTTRPAIVKAYLANILALTAITPTSAIQRVHLTRITLMWVSSLIKGNRIIKLAIWSLRTSTTQTALKTLIGNVNCKAPQMQTRRLCI